VALIGAPQIQRDPQFFVTRLRTSKLIGPILDCIVAGQNEDCESE
jgi:hypothetical protein